MQDAAADKELFEHAYYVIGSKCSGGFLLLSNQAP